MIDDGADREPIVSEGRHAVVSAADDESCDYWLLADDGAAFPIAQKDVDDAATALVRLRDLNRDAESGPETIELTCHECGKTWQHAGDDEHASCPNCETEVPVEGLGP